MSLGSALGDFFDSLLGEEEVEAEEGDAFHDTTNPAHPIKKDDADQQQQSQQRAPQMEEEEEEGEDKDELEVLKQGFWSAVGTIEAASKKLASAVRDDLQEFRTSLASETKSLLAEKKRELERREQDGESKATRKDSPQPARQPKQQEKEGEGEVVAVESTRSAFDPQAALERLQESFWTSTLKTLPGLLGVNLNDESSASLAADDADGKSPSTPSSSSSALPPPRAASSPQRSPPSSSAASPSPSSVVLRKSSLPSRNADWNRIAVTTERLTMLLRRIGLQGTPPSTIFCLRLHQRLQQRETFIPPKQPEKEQEFLKLVQDYEDQWLVFLKSSPEPVDLSEFSPECHPAPGMDESQDFVSRILELTRGHLCALFPRLHQFWKLFAEKGRSDSTLWMAFIFVLSDLWQEEQKRIRIISSPHPPGATRPRISPSPLHSRYSSPRSPIAALTSWSDDDDDDGGGIDGDESDGRTSARDSDGSYEFVDTPVSSSTKLLSPSPGSVTPTAPDSSASQLGRSSRVGVFQSPVLNLSWSDTEDDD